MSDSGDGKGAYIEFKKGAVVQVKIASSFISPEQAGLIINRNLAIIRKLEETSDPLL